MLGWGLSEQYYGLAGLFRCWSLDNRDAQICSSWRSLLLQELRKSRGQWPCVTLAFCATRFLPDHFT